jgi:sulfide:quinone oxidoreductase
MNVRHVKNEVVGLKDNNRVVLLKNGAQVDNDALIIASGGHFTYTPTLPLGRLM